MVKDLEYYDQFTEQEMVSKVKTATLFIRICDTAKNKDDRVTNTLKAQRDILLSAIDRQREKAQKEKPPPIFIAANFASMGGLVQKKL